MTSGDRQQYIAEVVRAVYGEPEEARVPPFEWGVIQSWMDREVPLRTILQTIEQMPKHPSIRYVKEAVELEEDRRRRALS